MTDWTVRVDWTRDDAPDEAELEQLMDTLAGLHVVLNFERTDDVVHVYATATVEAVSLRDAINTMLEAVETAAGVEADGLEVLRAAEFERQLNRPNLPELVGLADIAEMLGVSRQRAAQIAEKPDFPPTVMQLRSGPMRVRRQVQRWATNRNPKPGRPRQNREAEPDRQLRKRPE